MILRNNIITYLNVLKFIYQIQRQCLYQHISYKIHMIMFFKLLNKRKELVVLTLSINVLSLRSYVIRNFYNLIDKIQV